MPHAARTTVVVVLLLDHHGVGRLTPARPGHLELDAREGEADAPAELLAQEVAHTAQQRANGLCVRARPLCSAGVRGFWGGVNCV